jgi:hypothetical protein
MAREHGIAIDVLTETFLQFRTPFLHELGRIARRRRLQTDEAMDLMLAASRVFDRLLLGLINGFGDLAVRTATAAGDAGDAAMVAPAAEARPARRPRLARGPA